MEESLTLEQQGDAAKDFLAGLVQEFGLEADVTFTEVDEDTVQVAATGGDLGLLVGPWGATLAAIQDLTRTFVQRQSESRTDRILVDVAGYSARSGSLPCVALPKAWPRRSRKRVRNATSSRCRRLTAKSSTTRSMRSTVSRLGPKGWSRPDTL